MVVVDLGEVRVEGDRGAIVRLGLVGLAERAVQADQVDVGLDERRVGGEGGLVLLDRGLQVAGLGQIDAFLQPRESTGLEVENVREVRVGDGRPAELVLLVEVQLLLGLVLLAAGRGTPARERSARRRNRATARKPSRGARPPPWPGHRPCRSGRARSGPRLSAAAPARSLRRSFGSRPPARHRVAPSRGAGARGDSRAAGEPRSEATPRRPRAPTGSTASCRDSTASAARSAPAPAPARSTPPRPRTARWHRAACRASRCVRRRAASRRPPSAPPRSARGPVRRASRGAASGAAEETGPRPGRRARTRTPPRRPCASPCSRSSRLALRSWPDRSC